MHMQTVFYRTTATYNFHCTCKSFLAMLTGPPQAVDDLNCLTAIYVGLRY